MTEKHTPGPWRVVAPQAPVKARKGGQAFEWHPSSAEHRARVVAKLKAEGYEVE